MSELETGNSETGTTTAVKHEFYIPPAKWNKIRISLIEMVENGTLADYVGISPTQEQISTYHGTSLEKVLAIAKSGGMKPFVENDYSEPAIFVTTSPTNALKHAVISGPHDTLRINKKIIATHNPDEAALLCIVTPKSWLSSQVEATKLRDNPLAEWVRIPKGLPATYKKIDSFIRDVTKEVDVLTRGKEASDFGVQFPVTFIPNEFIFVVTPEGNLMPIETYVAELEKASPTK